MLRAWAPSLLLCLVAGLAAGEAGAWSGVLVVSEAISGEGRKAGGENEELERLAQIADERIRQGRTELAQAPAVVTRILKEDIGAFEAERDRSVVPLGRPFALAETTYSISRGRMLVQSGGDRWLIDRTRNTCLARIGGETRDIPLAPAPKLAAPEGAVGALPMFQMPCIAFKRQLKERSYSVVLAPDLPNPYALGLLAVDTGSRNADLLADLAKLPGLPMVVIREDEQTQYHLVVTRFVPGELPDALFAPWK